MNFENVTAVAKANVYFDGKVVSHSILFGDGSKKTLGLIYPGEYHFGTDAAEEMAITDGACEGDLGMCGGVLFAQDIGHALWFQLPVSEGVVRLWRSFGTTRVATSSCGPLDLGPLAVRGPRCLFHRQRGRS